VFVGSKIIGADERMAIAILVVGRQRLAIRRNASDRVRIVTRNDEFTAAGRQDGRWTATILFPEDVVFLAIPGQDRAAAIFDIEELVLVPDGAFGKPGIVVDDFDVCRVGANGGEGERQRSTEKA